MTSQKRTGAKHRFPLASDVPPLVLQWAAAAVDATDEEVEVV
jgi:hypothetical protein